MHEHYLFFRQNENEGCYYCGFPHSFDYFYLAVPYQFETFSKVSPILFMEPKHTY